MVASGRLPVASGQWSVVSDQWLFSGRSGRFHAGRPWTSPGFGGKPESAAKEGQFGGLFFALSSGLSGAQLEPRLEPRLSALPL